MNQKSNSELARRYFIDGGCNCAEAVLHVLDEKYELGLSAESFQVIAGFGGGIASGNLCGALAGAVGGLGRLLVAERAHTTPNFRESFSGLISRLEDRFGSLNCRDIKPAYEGQPERCLPVVIAAVDVFDAWWSEICAS